MQEEERLRWIKRINEKKQIKQKREEFESELELLKENPCVKRYFELDKGLKSIPIVTDEAIEKEIYGYTDSFLCEHDICCLLYVERIAKDGGRVRRQGSEEAHYFVFRCLECDKIIDVFREYLNEFLYQHRVVIGGNSDDYEIYRRRYFEHLLEYPTEEAYQKMKKLFKK